MLRPFRTWPFMRLPLWVETSSWFREVRGRIGSSCHIHADRKASQKSTTHQTLRWVGYNSWRPHRGSTPVSQEQEPEAIICADSPKLDNRRLKSFLIFPPLLLRPHPPSPTSGESRPHDHLRFLMWSSEMLFLITTDAKECLVELPTLAVQISLSYSAMTQH